MILKGDKFMWIIGLVAIAFVLFYAVNMGRQWERSRQTQNIDKALKQREAEINERWSKTSQLKDSAILQRDVKIAELTRQYNRLYDEIKRQNEKLKELKYPTTIEELRKRFNDLGYPPR